MEWLKEIGGLAQTGATGVAIVALIILWRIVVKQNGDHAAILNRNSESQENLCQTIGVHSECIRSLKETIERKL